MYTKTKKGNNTDSSCKDTNIRMLTEKSSLVLQHQPVGEREKLLTRRGGGSVADSTAGAGRQKNENLADRDARLQLQSRCAELEYKVVVLEDELRDVKRERNALQTELENSKAVNKVRRSGDLVLLHGEGVAGRTVRDIDRASRALTGVGIGNGGEGALATDVTTTAATTSEEELFRLQSELRESAAQRSQLEKELESAKKALKTIQDTAIVEVGKVRADYEAEIISLQHQLKAASAKQQDMRRSAMAADQIISLLSASAAHSASHSLSAATATAENLNANNMSEYTSHTIVVPSATVFQRLRAEQARTFSSSAFSSAAIGGHNNTSVVTPSSTFKGKYDVSIEFAPSTQSIVLKGKRLCVELLKGEVYAALNALSLSLSLSSAENSPSTAEGTAGHKRGTVFLPPYSAAATTPMVGSSTNSGDFAADTQHLCRTISTHEATISALHTAIQHAQDRARQSEAKAEEAKLHISYVEEKMKQTQILCNAKEKEFANECASLKAQLVFAEEKAEKALRSLQDEAAVSSHYRDDSDRLREEIEQLVASKEMADRTGYVASEQLKMLTIRADEAMKTASKAIADKEHADRLQKEVATLREEAEKKAEHYNKEIGALQCLLNEREGLLEQTMGRFNELELTIETSQTEIEVQRELINELRNRLLLALNSNGGSGGFLPSSAAGSNGRSGGGDDRVRSSSSSSLPILSNMSNAELLRKLSVPAPATSSGDGGGGGLNATPRAGGGKGGARAPSSYRAQDRHSLNTTGVANGGSSSSNALLALPSSPLPNDMLTMQIIEDLYTENDSLKAELEQAHKDIREVAHALKETREVREQAIKEAERLQAEKARWTEEKAAHQREKLEEQLNQRQKVAEHELAMAAVKEELRQSRARCAALQKQLAAHAATTAAAVSSFTFSSNSTRGLSSGPPLVEQYGVPYGHINDAYRSSAFPPQHTKGTSNSSNQIRGEEGRTEEMANNRKTRAYSPNTLAAAASARLAALASSPLPQESSLAIDEFNGAQQKSQQQRQQFDLPSASQSYYPTGTHEKRESPNHLRLEALGRGANVSNMAMAPTREGSPESGSGSRAAAALSSSLMTQTAAQQSRSQVVAAAVAAARDKQNQNNPSSHSSITATINATATNPTKPSENLHAYHNNFSNSGQQQQQQQRKTLIGTLLSSPVHIPHTHKDHNYSTQYYLNEEEKSGGDEAKSNEVSRGNEKHHADPHADDGLLTSVHQKSMPYSSSASGNLKSSFLDAGFGGGGVRGTEVAEGFANQHQHHRMYSPALSKYFGN